MKALFDDNGEKGLVVMVRDWIRDERTKEETREEIQKEQHQQNLENNDKTNRKIAIVRHDHRRFQLDLCYLHGRYRGQGSPHRALRSHKDIRC